MSDPEICRECRAPCVIDVAQNLRSCTRCGLVGPWVPPGTYGLDGLTYDARQQIDTGDSSGSHIEGSSALTRAQRRSNTWSAPCQRRRQRLSTLVDELSYRLQSSERLRSDAKRVLRRLLDEHGVKRVKKDELLCAVSLCFASRALNAPYSFKEIAEKCAQVTKKEICRTFKLYERRLGKSRAVASLRTKHYLPRLGGHLGLSFREQRRVAETCRQFERCPSIRCMNPLTKLAISLTLHQPKCAEHAANAATLCGVSVPTLLKGCRLACDAAEGISHRWHLDWSPLASTPPIGELLP